VCRGAACLSLGSPLGARVPEAPAALDLRMWHRREGTPGQRWLSLRQLYRRGWAKGGVRVWRHAELVSDHAAWGLRSVRRADSPETHHRRLSMPERNGELHQKGGGTAQVSCRRLAGRSDLSVRVQQRRGQHIYDHASVCRLWSWGGSAVREDVGWRRYPVSRNSPRIAGVALGSGRRSQIQIHTGKAETAMAQQGVGSSTTAAIRKWRARSEMAAAEIAQVRRVSQCTWYGSVVWLPAGLGFWAVADVRV
jgi:hypothetical protein